MRIILYTADHWEHVCPMLRVIIPSRQVGIEVLQGVEWVDEQVQVHLDRIHDADIVVIQRDFPQFETQYQEIITIANHESKPVVYDLDDLLIELHSNHPDFVQYRKARFQILRAVYEADLVTAASQYLCTYLAQFNSNAILLPNYLIDELVDIKPEFGGGSTQDTESVTIGYMGGHSHAPDLDMIAPVLKDLLDHYGENIRMRFWGLAPPTELRGRDNIEVFIPGTINYNEFASYFRSQKADIFIAPLIDTTFNRCKSSLKFLEYSALGSPGVYSHIVPYADVVHDGHNGFLASSLDDWRRCLTELIENPGVRKEMGQHAYQTVNENWRLDGHENIWLEGFEKAKSIRAQRVFPSGSLLGFEKIITWSHELENALADEQKLLHERKIQLQEAKDTVEDLHRLVNNKQIKIEEINVKLDEYRNQLDEQRIQLRQLEDAKDSIQSQLTNAGRDLNETRSSLNAILGSTGWRFLQWLYQIRIRLIPHGGLRERWFHAAIKAVHYWHTYGTRQFVKKLIEPLRRSFGRKKSQIEIASSSGPEHQAVTLSFEAVKGEICPDPAISIVVLMDSSSGELIGELTGWVRRQTLQSLEIICWSRKNERVWKPGFEEEGQQAPDFQVLAKQLLGRYVCFASVDLLQQSETYLEENLVALQSEELLFTVNALGDAAWIREGLSHGRLPGNLADPLARIVARKGNVGSNLELNLSDGLTLGSKRVVGKIITHTTNQRDTPGAIAFGSIVGDVRILCTGNHIVVGNEADEPCGLIQHVTHPVDSVLPAHPQATDLPTVIVVMPFLAVGGAERLLLHVMRHLADKIRFIVLTVEGYDDRLGTTADDFRQITPWVYTAMDFLENHLLYSYLTYLISRFSPQTIYIANGANWIYDALSTIKAQFPNIRLVDQVYHHLLGWIARYDPAIVSSFDAHIGGNEKICKAYIGRGVKTSHVYLVEHGIESSELDPQKYSKEGIDEIKERLDLSLDRQVISFVARMHPQKRPMDFVELARRFAKVPSIIFLMVGDGPLAPQVEKGIDRLDLHNIVRHTFYTPIADIYAISDLLVLPSEYEATPLVLLEAQAMGRPLVVTDVGNNREILDHTKGGQVVDKIGDIEALYNAVQQALTKPIDSRKVRDAILKRYDMPIIAEKYRRVLIEQ